MRILLGYYYYKYPYDVERRINDWLGRLRKSGIHVDGFCLTLNAPGPRLKWNELERRWKIGNKALFSMYEKLAKRLEDYDVFVNWNGINLHPYFVQQLPTFNVYGCFDDPESSEDLSKPAAWAYDLSMVGNIAELESYRSWGVKEVRYWPMGFFADDFDPELTKEDILKEDRTIDVGLLCERQSLWRADRLEKFSAAFPQGAYYGKGWPQGFLAEEQKVPFYRRTKIGPNFHNSTGPINFRTFMLPANGVMQLCDNKSHLGKVFELNKEVMGFDTVEEAIDLCQYYLAHDDERRSIAAAGWERAIRDYNEVAIFGLVEKYVKELQPALVKRQNNVVEYLGVLRKKTIFVRCAYYVKVLILSVLKMPVRLLRYLHRRFSQTQKMFH